MAAVGLGPLEWAVNYFWEADALQKCKDSILNGSLGSQGSEDFVKGKLKQYRLGPDKLVKGANCRAETAKWLSDEAQRNLELGLCAVEAALVVTAFIKCHQAAEEIAKQGTDIKMIRGTLLDIACTYFSSDAELQALMANKERLTLAINRVNDVHKTVNEVREAAERARTCAKTGAALSTAGLVLGVLMGYGATTLLGRLIGGAGAISSAVAGYQNLQQWVQANDLFAEMDGYDQFLTTCQRALNSRNGGCGLTESEMKDLFERSGKVRDEIRRRRGQ